MLDLSGIGLPAPAPRDLGAEPGRADAGEPPHGVDFTLLLELLAANDAVADPRLSPGAAADAAARLLAAAGYAPAGEDGGSLPAGGRNLPLDGSAAGQARMLAALALLAGRADGVLRPGEPRPLLPAGTVADASQLVLPATGANAPASPSAAPLAATPGAAPSGWQPLTPGSQTFEAALGQRLLWMAGRGVQDARLQVHPEHLGPIDIRLRLDGDSAQLLAAATQAVTRDALEQALPRLREQLAEAGLQLTQADVGDRGPEGRSPHASPSWLREHPGDDAVAGASSEVTLRAMPVPGLLDLFA